MSWHFSRALVEAYSAHISSDSIQYALSREMSTVDAYSCNGKTKGIYPHSQYGMTFVHLPAEAGWELLTSYLADSHVRRSAPQQEAEIMQRTYGLTWQGLYKRPCQPMCLPRTCPIEQLTLQQSNSVQWVTMSSVFPSVLTNWVHVTFGKDFGFLHTPTTKANYSAQSMQKWPSCRNFVAVFGRPSPQNQEWMMGYPDGWTDTNHVEMDKFQLWRQRLCGHLQTVKLLLTPGKETK